VNKVCGSGLKTVMLAAQAIQVGDADVVVAGGMENMSMAPHFLDKSRTGYRMGHGVLRDHMIHDGLWDHVNDFHMGISNDLCADKYGVSREDQDRYAAESYRRSRAAIAAGKFRDEIMTVELPQRKGAPVVFDRDECPRKTSYEALSTMRPAFQENGTATAGNASIISDGAAAVVVMAREKADALGCRILATIGAQAAYGIEMKYVLVAPIWAVPKCLAKQNIAMEAVDRFEINEAFSGSTLAAMRELNLDPHKVNVNGGAVSLGHPIGASGCRVLVTLIHELIREDLKTGLASLCLGGGEAVALVVTRS
nr:acetyl-CoA C-acyltransferase [Desulfobacterales bacterium]